MTLTQKSREGYLLVDHRASPGLTEAEARFVGYDPKLAGEGQMFEAATLTCSHCKASVVKNPLRTRERPFCFSCYHYICDLCELESRHPGYSHLPFEKARDVYMDYAARGMIINPKTLEPLGPANETPAQPMVAAPETKAPPTTTLIV